MIYKKLAFLLVVPFIFILYSCEDTTSLGPMEFKFTGINDTVNYQGSTLNQVVKIYFLGGENELVSLSASGVPAGTSITFSPSSIKGDESCTERILSTATADTGIYLITVTGTTESGKSLSKQFNLRISRLPNGAPKIFLTGGTTIYIQQLNAPYVEPGWIAGDEEDGDLTAQVVSSGTVNVDSVGLYFLSYVVTDSEGLIDSVTRTVSVRNSLNSLNGQYNVNTTDLNSGSIRNWITTVSASVSLNNEFKIFKISDCFYANPILNYDPVKDSIYLPIQTFSCVTAIDSLPHTFEGRGVLIKGVGPGNYTGIRLEYTNTWVDTSLGTPVTLQLRDDYQKF